MSRLTLVLALALVGCTDDKVVVDDSIPGGDSSVTGDDSTADDSTADDSTDDSSTDDSSTDDTGSGPDTDGDGVPDAEDCAPEDPSAYPGATETCDGVDDDCDGAIDEEAADAPTWYPDGDGDGYGRTDEPLLSCSQPSGYAAAAGDCDDADVAYNPGATESDCSDPNDYNCDGAVGFADGDGDGFAACEECDDTDASVNPGAQEVCDPLNTDEDCDGQADDADDSVQAEGRSTWYTDADGDTYGDPSAGVLACDQPAGTVLDATDCDDADVSINPAASEVCDGADNDCDGDVDADDSSLDASTAGSYYTDSDGDGFGTGSAVTACSPPAGSSTVGGDCDDSDADSFPGGVEVCDSADNDCNGSVDDNATDFKTYYVDADADGYGDAAYSTQACSRPTGYIGNKRDCDDSDSGVNPAASELCNGVDDDCDGTVDDSATDATTWYIDSDGDGYGDSSVSALSCDALSGYSTADGDCDDSDTSVSPAATEVCNGLDDNCDTSIDDGVCSGCSTETYDGDTYLFCDTAAAWSSAQATCASYGYHLIAVDDAAEDAWANATADTYSTNKWWIGFNDIASEGSFVWDGGSSSTYTNWGSGEPNNAGDEDCAQFNRFTDDTWNDEPCSTAFRYICELD